MAWTKIFAAPPSCVRRRSLALGVILLSCCTGPLKSESGSDATKLPLATTDAPHPLDPALKLARESWEHSQANVRDYTAILTKRTRVDGELSPHQRAHVKIRNHRVEQGRISSPMSVYMKFLHPESSKGREVIWVEGRNNGKLVAHEAGLKNLLRVHLDPKGMIAMRGQRYPIMEVGLERLIEQVIEKGIRDRQHGECQVDFYQEAKVDNRSCRMVQIIHPVKRPHFDFHRAQVFFDNELRLPIRYASWSWPADPSSQPILEEEYTYTNVTTNVGLTDRDFDPDNPDYNF